MRYQQSEGELVNKQDRGITEILFFFLGFAQAGVSEPISFKQKKRENKIHLLKISDAIIYTMHLFSYQVLVVLRKNTWPLSLAVSASDLI